MLPAVCVAYSTVAIPDVVIPETASLAFMIRGIVCVLYHTDELVAFAATPVPFTFTCETSGAAVSTVKCLVTAAVFPERSVTVAVKSYAPSARSVEVPVDGAGSEPTLNAAS